MNTVLLFSVPLLFVLPEACRRNCCGPEKYDAKVVHQSICECLKHAPQREGRRQKRLAMCENNPNNVIGDIVDEDTDSDS
jgi:hypothetical protein